MIALARGPLDVRGKGAGAQALLAPLSARA